MNGQKTVLTSTEFPCWKCGAFLNRLDPPIHGWRYHCLRCQMLTSPAEELAKAMADKAAGAVGIVAGLPCTIHVE